MYCSVGYFPYQSMNLYMPWVPKYQKQPKQTELLPLSINVTLLVLIVWRLTYQEPKEGAE